ncbi:hypothetical protein HMI55_001987 [Coelomomyces lativittatus]|nr:hypothetical protein HMI55_001987 [Coelomomyces lativittatus]
MFPYKVNQTKLLDTRQNEFNRFFNTENKRTSDYQWLPTDVSVDKEGNCKFRSYINNLFRTEYPNLYPILESILSCFIPLFEKSLNTDLKQKQIQVIVKAADYILEPGQSYEGNWHLEGTPQENIIATGIYYYEVSKEIVDEGLAFRRQGNFEFDWPSHVDSDFIPWCTSKLGSIFSGLNSLETSIEKKINNVAFTQELTFAYLQTTLEIFNIRKYVKTIPVGHVETKPGRCIVFPNVLQHKVTGIHAPTSATQQQKRRILCFFLVDPNRPIPSTLSVKPQQKGYYTNFYFGILKNLKIKGNPVPVQIIHHILNHFVSGLSLKEALELRIKFMYDRRLISDKRNDDFENEFSLCEH